MTISIMKTEGSFFLVRSKENENISYVDYWRKICDCIQTITNLNTNSPTHLPHKACDLITLMKCIGEEFWGSGYELVFLITVIILQSPGFEVAVPDLSKV